MSRNVPVTAIVAVVVTVVLLGGVVLGLPVLTDDSAKTEGPVVQSTDTVVEGTTDAPTEEATPTVTAGDKETVSSGPATTTAGQPRFVFTVDSITECGTTCRDVTARLTNEGVTTGQNVTVVVSVFAGDDRLWRGTETVGSLPAGESYTTTRTVDVGLTGGVAIRSNGGYVTIETVVRHADGTRWFEERRAVA
jgi:hypothetical protein